MKKYVEIAKVCLKVKLVWRADTVFHMIFTVTKILFAYLLWGILFQGKDEIAGFTFYGMLSYYIISSFLSQMEMSDGISGEISTRIRNGTFSKYMIIPVSIEKYFMAMEAGVVCFYFLFDLIAAFIWTFLFRIQFVFTDNIGMVVCAVFMILIGFLFMVQFNYYLGLLTLKYEEISMFLMIKNNLVALVTGTIIPLVLFPEEVIRFMKLFPFYYVTYLPSMLLVGRCRNEAVMGVVIITGWCIIMQTIIKVTWVTYRRKYDGVGI